MFPTKNPNQTRIDQGLRNLFAANNLNLPSKIGPGGKIQDTLNELQPPSIGMTPLPIINSSSGSGAQVAGPTFFPQGTKISNDQWNQLSKSSVSFKPASIQGQNIIIQWFYLVIKQIDFSAMTQDQKIAIFKQFLTQLGVTATWRWDDVSRSIALSKDRRKNAIDTRQKKKLIFMDFLNQCKKKQRAIKNSKKQSYRDSFIRMLEQNQHKIRPQSRFSQVVILVGADPRFKTLEQKERQILFQEFMEDLEKKQRNQQKERSAQNVSSIRAFLQSRSLSLQFTWKDAQIEFQDIGIWKDADGYDRILQVDQ